MIYLFKKRYSSVFAVQVSQLLTNVEVNKLIWLFGYADLINDSKIDALMIGPRREIITPWSTNAVEITQIMGINGITRIELFQLCNGSPSKEDLLQMFDPMLQTVYDGIGQDIFSIYKKPDKIILVENIDEYNKKEGLALNQREIEYLNGISRKLGRKLTDSEIFGFSQVNSEHCRHKIFNGTFIIDGIEKRSTLFQLIKQTSEKNPNSLVSAYKDNVAFNKGPIIEQFAPISGEKSDFFTIKKIEVVLSLKAETHNFPTTVEPFNGASTGSGGEIRDRLGGGKASLPIAGMAVYMTSYPWNRKKCKKWLYQRPEQVLIKASNGTSDFGNKFGQPLICGSILTFEHKENGKKYGYDKVIMMAGGVGFSKKSDAFKEEVQIGEKIVILGGDNYRIGMGGGSISSINTGEYVGSVELNAIQRANPEMQKRIANVIRTFVEAEDNPIISIHDHGAGGHLNCLSELVEHVGGKIEMDQLPIGDSTLSAREIILNESQERMGLILRVKDVDRFRKIAERERAPMYVVGKTIGGGQLIFEQKDGKCPLDVFLNDFLGKSPPTIISDATIKETFKIPKYRLTNFLIYLEKVLRLEAVACKDWLTNKVDRSVSGKVACQQCVGELQLPLSDLGVVALDYRGNSGIAMSIGHAPQIALVDASIGSVVAIAESLTNIVFAPLRHGLKSISLSANWMWPCKNKGEDARLYQAVESCSRFACDLGINIPTGKDSLFMTQKYKNQKVYAPGTVIISATAEVIDVKKIVSPFLIQDVHTTIYYVDFSSDYPKLGGSAFYQSFHSIGSDVPTVKDPQYFKNVFNAIQLLICKKLILAGHDISAGGIIITLLEMCFGNMTGGMNIDLSSLWKDENIIQKLFSENSGIIIQVKDTESVEKYLQKQEIRFETIGHPIEERSILLSDEGKDYCLNIDYLRDIWYHTSYLLDKQQSGKDCAKNRFNNYKHQPLINQFPLFFTGKMSSYGISANRKGCSKIRAAVIREKGTNGEREMAYALYLVGFDVKDIHMTDLAMGKETLEDIHIIVFCGGFSHSDVFGSAKGWAGTFLYNKKSRIALEKFYNRCDTLSLGVCNGCQLMVELYLICFNHMHQPLMLPNQSNKFESAFISVEIPQNRSVLFHSLSGSILGIWVAHGEGKFRLSMNRKDYHIVAQYAYDCYPGNPNGSDYSAAGICSEDGRHVALMPHLERSIFPWQWAYYPQSRKTDDISPWIEVFINAYNWIFDKLSK